MCFTQVLAGRNWIICETYPVLFPVISPLEKQKETQDLIGFQAGRFLVIGGKSFQDRWVIEFFGERGNYLGRDVEQVQDEQAIEGVIK